MSMSVGSIEYGGTEATEDTERLSPQRFTTKAKGTKDTKGNAEPTTVLLFFFCFVCLSFVSFVPFVPCPPIPDDGR